MREGQKEATKREGEGDRKGGTKGKEERSTRGTRSSMEETDEHAVNTP